MVHHQGLEPWAHWLRVSCSTIWANGVCFLSTCSLYIFLLRLSTKIFIFFNYFYLPSNLLHHLVKELYKMVKPRNVLKHYIARVTLFERKHLVQTFIDLLAPFTNTFTFFTLGFHALLLFLLEWLTFNPKDTPLLHTSHFATKIHPLQKLTNTYTQSPTKPDVFTS